MHPTSVFRKRLPNLRQKFEELRIIAQTSLFDVFRKLRTGVAQTLFREAETFVKTRTANLGVSLDLLLPFLTLVNPSLNSLVLISRSRLYPEVDQGLCLVGFQV